MTYIVNEEWEELKLRTPPLVWERIKLKAQWEGMTTSAVVAEYPELLPARLRRAAARCFVDTYGEWVDRRLEALRRAVRELEGVKRRSGRTTRRTV